jgi:hypothetical protein
VARFLVDRFLADRLAPFFFGDRFLVDFLAAFFLVDRLVDFLAAFRFFAIGYGSFRCSARVDTHRLSAGALRSRGETSSKRTTMACRSTNGELAAGANRQRIREFKEHTMLIARIEPSIDHARQAESTENRCSSEDC